MIRVPEVFTKNGLFHREDGPAWILPMSERWFINGEDITDKVQDLFNRNQLNSDWSEWTNKDLAKFKLYCC